MAAFLRTDRLGVLRCHSVPIVFWCIPMYSGLFCCILPQPFLLAEFRVSSVCMYLGVIMSLAYCEVGFNTKVNITPQKCVS